MLLLDVSHTSHTRARTGVQQVVRSLLRALPRSCPTEPVTFDPYRRHWRTLEAWEHDTLRDARPGGARGARWPWRARWRGRLSRVFPGPQPVLPAADHGVLVPEIFSPAVATRLPELFPAGRPRVALFHDAIALRLPELTPSKTVARFPAYLQELLAFDGIAAVSADSRAALLDYWSWLELSRVPPVLALPLGLDPVSPPAPVPPTDVPTVLVVGSIEGRKNHLALLEAAERLWREGLKFQLNLIGLPRPETAGAALTRIRELQAAERPLQFHGAVADEALARAYATCAFTVYPSRMEGFGLPVLESLQYGRPCICSGLGALGESARGGGCLTLASLDEAALAAAIRWLLTEPELHRRLTAEALARRFRSWDDYGRDLVAWMDELRPRAPA